jgi:hypothetical protein
MNASAQPAPPPADQLVAAVLDLDADRQADQIVQLATITLLIDAGLITAEDAIARIEALARHLAHAHLADDVALRIERMIELIGERQGSRPRGWQPKLIEGGAGALLSARHSRSHA